MKTLFVAVVASVSIALQPQQSNVVTVLERPGGFPLVEQLPPGDAPVWFKRFRDEERGVYYEWTADEEIVFNANNSDGVVILDVRGVVGMLVEGNSWIASKVTGRAADVLRWTPQLSVKSGDQITVQHEGGALMLAGRWVMAEPGQLFRASNRYLLFIKRDETVLIPYAAWRIRNDGTLGPIHDDRDPTLALDGMTIEHAVRIIRKSQEKH